MTNKNPKYNTNIGKLIVNSDFENFRKIVLETMNSKKDAWKQQETKTIQKSMLLGEAILPGQSNILPGQSKKTNSSE